jgi:hypothetical protein
MLEVKRDVIAGRVCSSVFCSCFAVISAAVAAAAGHRCRCRRIFSRFFGAFLQL